MAASFYWRRERKARGLAFRPAQPYDNAPAMKSFDLPSILAGLLACGVAVFASTALVFLAFRLNTMLRRRDEQERLLLSGHRSIAIALGATILSEALLLRHVVFPVMAVMRDLFLQRASLFTVFAMTCQCGIFFAIIGAVSIGSVWLAACLFTHMTGDLPEQEEILRDNMAVAIFYG